MQYQSKPINPKTLILGVGAPGPPNQVAGLRSGDEKTKGPI
jgi:hypothetical protein